MTVSNRSIDNSTHQCGIALMVLAMLLVPSLDVIAKILMERLPPLQVTFGRFLAQTLILLPLFLSIKDKGWPGKGHMAAGAFLGLALLSFNYALQIMPIANALAIFFVEPLVLTALGAVVLREKIGPRRVFAIIAGLCGVLVILRPNLALYGASAFYPLVTACFFACYMLVTRVMSQTGGQFILQFWTGFFATLVLLFGLCVKFVLSSKFVDIVPLTPNEFWIFICLGILAAVAHQLIVQALSRIEAGAAAPYQYLEIASAVLLGWLVFNDFPDVLTWLGTAIIVASGIYAFSDAFRNKSN